MASPDVPVDADAASDAGLLDAPFDTALDTALDAPRFPDAPDAPDAPDPTTCFEGPLIVGDDPGIHGTRSSVVPGALLPLEDGWLLLYTNSTDSLALHLTPEGVPRETISLGFRVSFYGARTDAYLVDGEVVVRGDRLARLGLLEDDFATVYDGWGPAVLAAQVVPGARGSGAHVQVLRSTWDSTTAGLSVTQLALGDEAAFEELEFTQLPVETPVPRCRFGSDGGSVDCLATESSGETRTWRHMRFERTRAGVWALVLDVGPVPGPDYVYEVVDGDRALTSRSGAVYIESFPAAPVFRERLFEGTATGWRVTPTHLLIGSDDRLRAYDRATLALDHDIPIEGAWPGSVLVEQDGVVMAAYGTRVPSPDPDFGSTAALVVRCFEL